MTCDEISKQIAISLCRYHGEDPYEEVLDDLGEYEIRWKTNLAFVESVLFVIEEFDTIVVEDLDD